MAGRLGRGTTVLLAGVSAVVLGGVAPLSLAAPPDSVSTVALADEHVVHQGSNQPMIHDAVEPDVAWDAQANAIDSGTAENPRRDVLGTYANYPDFGHGELKYMNSTDGGDTFVTGSAQGQPAQVIARAADGSLIAFRRSPMTRNADGTVPMHVVHSSTNDFPTTNDGPDLLENWPADSPTTGWSLIPTHISHDRAGKLLMSAYVFPSNAPGRCSGTMLARSIDASASRWEFVGMSSEWGVTGNFYEAGVARTADGSLIAAIRHQGCNATSGYFPLKWRKSTDDGRTWSDIDVEFPESWRDGGDIVPQEKEGLDPRIMPRPVLLPNGMLAIHAGRPWNRIAVDNEGGVTKPGEPISFDSAMITHANTYTNLPTDGTIPLKYTSWWNYFANAGTSGNLGIAVTDANRVVTVMDNCHPWVTGGVLGDQCNKGDGTNEDHILDEDDNNDIYRRQVDIVTPGTGKLDLPTKVRSGAFRVSTNLDDTFPGQPRTGTLGAVDGSALPWSGALSDSTTPGTYTITFDRPYDLSKVGLLAGFGLKSGAKVEWRDGSRWRSLTSVPAATSYSLRYQDVQARGATAVRVTVDPIAGPAEGACPNGGDRCVLLNELELFAADVDTFDNDPIGTPPRGVEYTGDGVRVVKGDGAPSTRVLSVESSAVTFPASRFGTGRRADVGVDVSGGAARVELLGQTRSGRSVSAYSVDLAGLSAGWHRVRVLAVDARGPAAVTVDGRYFRTVWPMAGVDRLGGVRMSGEHLLVDDVQQRHAS